MDAVTVRNVNVDDYQRVIAVVNDWWGGRSVSELLPKLFFVHFRETSLLAECDGQLAGFLIGFFSQTYPDEAYVHFAGVRPDLRKAGLGRILYERFFEVMKTNERTVVRCITSPVNEGSIAFHLRMGFEIEPQQGSVAGTPVIRNYDGRGGDRVLFVRRMV